MVVLGDFNRHHPLWDRKEDNHLFTANNINRAHELIDLMAELNLEMALPPGYPTIEHFRSKKTSRPDNVWVAGEMLDRIVMCKVELAARPILTDYYPIRTEIDIITKRAEYRETLNFKHIDWDKFRATMKEKFASWNRVPQISSTEEFEQLRKELTTVTALQQTIEQHAPITRFTHYSRRWWTKEVQDSRGRRNDVYNERPPNYEGTDTILSTKK